MSANNNLSQTPPSVGTTVTPHVLNQGVNQTAFLAAAAQGNLPEMLYYTFGEGQATPWLAVPSGALSLVALMGILMNSAVVYVTCCAKNLRGTCQFLLALTCLGEVLHQLNHLIFFAVTSVGGNFIEFGLCLALQMPSVFGLNCVQIALAVTALDRLIAAFWPLLYKQVNEDRMYKLFYLSLCTTLIVAAGLGLTIYTNISVQKYAQAKCTCDIADVLNTPESYAIFFGSVAVLNSFAVVLYLSVWVSIRKSINAGDAQKKLLRSLMTIVGVNIGGYFVNLGLMSIYKITLRGNFLLMWALFSFNVNLLNVCAAANAPILYWMSSDYRAAFQQHILSMFEGWSLFRCCCAFSRSSSGTTPLRGQVDENNCKNNNNNNNNLTVTNINNNNNNNPRRGSNSVRPSIIDIRAVPMVTVASKE